MQLLSLKVSTCNCLSRSDLESYLTCCYYAKQATNSIRSLCNLRQLSLPLDEVIYFFTHISHVPSLRLKWSLCHRFSPPLPPPISPSHSHKWKGPHLSVCMSTGREISCTGATVYEGEPATVTCHFNSDLSFTWDSFYINRLQPSHSESSEFMCSLFCLLVSLFACFWRGGGGGQGRLGRFKNLFSYG